MRVLIVSFILSLTLIGNAFAVDESSIATSIKVIGHWKIIQFAGARQIIYRISSTAINSDSETIAFNFIPSKNCAPAPAVIIANIGRYDKNLDDGFLPMSYKLPKQKQTNELVGTVMQRGTKIAFFPLKTLTVGKLESAKDKGNLAVWIPGSGDNSVKRSGNIYFSLNGFSMAYRKARTSCNENK